MNRRKLDSLMWENIPFDDFFRFHPSFKQENLDNVFWDDVDELIVSRDDDYFIKISCVRYINRYKNNIKTRQQVLVDEPEFGSAVPFGKLEIKLFDNYFVTFAPMYFDGYESMYDKTNYKLSCYRIEGNNCKEKAFVIKEWILNGSERGLFFCEESSFEYILEGAVCGKYGDMDFPVKEQLEERVYHGSFIHIKFKDTAFDVQFVGNNYGPDWSTNLCISYFEKYGRIPDIEERKVIRDYLSFFMGKRLLYIGETSFNEKGDEIGFVMENPHTYGFDVKKICMRGAKPPIRDENFSLNEYCNTVKKYINPFSDLYNKLDFESFFSAYWYAKEIAIPINLTILSAALESLKREWYKGIKRNPETVLIDKKEFKRRIKPIKELIQTQFIGTEYVDRMISSVENLNRMSVSEQLTYFFEGINMIIGIKKKRHCRRVTFLLMEHTVGIVLIMMNNIL